MIWHVPAETDEPTRARELCAHLSCRFEAQWRSYRKEFGHCRKGFSENSTHNLRVATRRLRATLGILLEVAPARAVEQTERCLKKVFKTLAPLREYHVQSEYLEKWRKRCPEAEVFLTLLRTQARAREKRARKRMKLRKLAELRESLRAIQKWFDQLLKDRSAQEACLDHIRSELPRKYSAAVARVRGIDPAKTPTIHRARVAFKQFRYGLESLHPTVVRISREQLTAMDGYQTLMGRIQDLEVLITGVKRFSDPKQADQQTTTCLREKLEKEKGVAIRKYLRSADRIEGFWPREFGRFSPNKSVNSRGESPRRLPGDMGKRNRRWPPAPAPDRKPG